MTDPIEAIARAVLYESYLLYPYRPSSVKNRVRWTFGGLFPRDYAEATGGSERWQARTECIVLDLRGGLRPPAARPSLAAQPPLASLAAGWRSLFASCV